MNHAQNHTNRSFMPGATPRRPLLAALTGLAVSLVLAPIMTAAAHDYRAGDLVIDHPWTRATPPAAQVAGGFMVIRNTGSTADRLIGGSFAQSRAVEIHEMAMEGGTMRMRELPRGLEIPPGGSVELRPGGFHVMFMGLARQLQQGESIEGTLVFERAGTVPVRFKVEAMGQRGGHHHH